MAESKLELDDIQSGVLRPRPTPYAATYVLFRIDDRNGGCELMRRLRSVVTSAAQSGSSQRDTWVSVALSYQGLKVLGVPQTSLQTFSPEFQQGMVARAKSLGDHGESSPEHWEKPLGTNGVHVVITAVAPNTERLEAAFERARKSYQELKGIAEPVRAWSVLRPALVESRFEALHATNGPCGPGRPRMRRRTLDSPFCFSICCRRASVRNWRR